MRLLTLRLLLTTAWMAAPFAQGAMEQRGDYQDEAAKPARPEKTSLADLMQVQKTVQAIMPQVRKAVVAIQTGDGTASGVIIDADGVILTAAHVAEKPGRELRVVLDDGSAVKAVTLGLDKTADAALMQLKDNAKKWPFVKVSREVFKAQPGEWCFALGHPGGFDKRRGVVLRVGKIIKQTANSLQTDCVLMGGDSGGPLFDLAGDVIGVHSQIWEARDQNIHVSMAPFLRSWNAMKGSEVIRTWGMGSGGYLGVATEMTDAGHLVVVDVIDGSPSQQAGLQAGDALLTLDGEVLSNQPQFSAAVRAHAAGDRVKLRVRSAGAEKDVLITLGSKPKDNE